MSHKLYNAYISKSSNKLKPVVHNPFYSDAFSIAVIILEMMGVSLN